MSVFRAASASLRATSKTTAVLRRQATAPSLLRTANGLRYASSAVTPAPSEPKVVPTADEIEADVQLAGLGYPQLPEVSRQRRPARAGWWDEQERINFNETLNEKDDALSMWAPDVHNEPPSRAFAQLALMSGVMALFAGLVYIGHPEKPGIVRQYPYDGLVQELSGTDDQQYAAIERKASSEESEEEDE